MLFQLKVKAKSKVYRLEARLYDEEIHRNWGIYRCDHLGMNGSPNIILLASNQYMSVFISAVIINYKIEKVW